VTGHPAGALPYSGTSACAPPGRCVSRCRPFGACRAGFGNGAHGVMRGRGTPPAEALPWPRHSPGRAGRGTPLAEQAEALPWPSRPSSSSSAAAGCTPNELPRRAPRHLAEQAERGHLAELAEQPRRRLQHVRCRVVQLPLG